MKLIILDGSHIADCRRIYRESVLAVDESIYSADQKREWAGYAASDQFPGFVLCGYACGILDHQCLAGFASATKGGHVNSLYVQPRSWGNSCASRLLERLLGYFDDNQELTADASKLSLPVFLKFGFSIIDEEIVDRNSVRISRFKMQR